MVRDADMDTAKGGAKKDLLVATGLSRWDVMEQNINWNPLAHMVHDRTLTDISSHLPWGKNRPSNNWAHFWYARGAC